eukprot:TRINITY_DN146375_c0_g1_i1.p1 TRINITY_DN146375_c0_g1~~TRINITY_DN146375_c0_g1_i1.p1  ORF type:complete len:770 (-),score=140.58 TRINITY_DN146375_c0_g1_i1:223-2325(-)
MLSSEMIESENRKVSLKQFSLEEFKPVFDFCMTRKLDKRLPIAKVSEVVDFLQINGLKLYIIGTILLRKSDSALSFLDKVIDLNIEWLTGACIDSIAKDWASAFNSFIFLDISEDTLCALLESDVIRGTELELLTFVAHWGETNPTANMTRVMENVRLELLSRSQLMDKYISENKFISSKRLLKALSYLESKEESKSNDEGNADEEHGKLGRQRDAPYQMALPLETVEISINNDFLQRVHEYRELFGDKCTFTCRDGKLSFDPFYLQIMDPEKSVEIFKDLNNECDMTDFSIKTVRSILMDVCGSNAYGNNIVVTEFTNENNIVNDNSAANTEATMLSTASTNINTEQPSGSPSESHTSTPTNNTTSGQQPDMIDENIDRIHFAYKLGIDELVKRYLIGITLCMKPQDFFRVAHMAYEYGGGPWTNCQTLLCDPNFLQMCFESRSFEEFSSVKTILAILRIPGLIIQDMWLVDRINQWTSFHPDISDEDKTLLYDEIRLGLIPLESFPKLIGRVGVFDEARVLRVYTELMHPSPKKYINQSKDFEPRTGCKAVFRRSDGIVGDSMVMSSGRRCLKQHVAKTFALPDAVGSKLVFMVGNPKTRYLHRFRLVNIKSDWSDVMLPANQTYSTIDFHQYGHQSYVELIRISEKQVCMRVYAMQGCPYQHCMAFEDDDPSHSISVEIMVQSYRKMDCTLFSIMSS